MKPIAYIDHVSGKPKLIDAYVIQTAIDIPLYTHPAQKPMMVLDGNLVYPAFKELTDEEITACIDESEPDIADMIRFARAILRKASEK